MGIILTGAVLQAKGKISRAYVDAPRAHARSLSRLKNAGLRDDADEGGG